MPEELDGRRLGTCTDSAQPVSNGLYASFGIVPRMPFLNLLGRPRGGWEPPPLPEGVVATRAEAAGDGTLDAAAQAELGKYTAEVGRLQKEIDQINFEQTRLQRVVATFLVHELVGKTPKLTIDERRQAIEGAPIARTPCPEEHSDVGCL